VYKISKTYTFSAAHQLGYLPDGHPCARPHGHNYTVEVILEGEINANHFVLDFNELDIVVAPIIALLDHRDLNKVLAYPTTSETIAWWLFNRINHDLQAACGESISAVRVSETPRTWAEYRPNDNR